MKRLVDDARARAAAAVVEIDDGAIERERLLDLAPVVLVGRDRVGGLALHGLARRPHARFAVVAERRGERGGPEALSNWRRDNMAELLGLTGFPSVFRFSEADAG